MSQPIYNIIYDAGLDMENMKSIENTTTNAEKIKNAFRGKWTTKIITDDDICNGLIDYNGAPDWIILVAEEERSAIQHEIIIGRNRDAQPI